MSYTPKVFLVEDNKADVELFRLALKEECVECEMVLFQDGSEIVSYIQKSIPGTPGYAPDLLVLDLNLPKIDGLEILQLIRDSELFANVPIAVLSSSSSARERAKLAAFNICEFIVKPPDLDEYLQIGKIVRGLLDGRKPQNSQP